MNEQPKRTVKKKFAIAEKASKAKGKIFEVAAGIGVLAIGAAVKGNDSDDDASDVNNEDE